MREGFLRNPESLPRASCATQNEEVAEQLSFLYLSTFPFNKLMPCAYIQKTSPIGLVLHFGLRRERDSNPRSLSAQRFSRPPQSTTLPSLLCRNWLARRNSPCEFGLPPLLLLTRVHEALVIFSWGDFFKSGAKVLLFFQLCKFLCTFFAYIDFL